MSLYAAGYFPMDDVTEAHNPLPFYAAERRAVLELDEASRAALRRRVRRSLRAGEDEGWRLVRDRHFEAVLEACARPREPGDGVWITERLQSLYRRLHEAGLAHSFEIEADGELAAGLVGVLLGRAAMLESMFHRVPTPATCCWRGPSTSSPSAASSCATSSCPPSTPSAWARGSWSARTTRRACAAALS